MTAATALTIAGTAAAAVMTAPMAHPRFALCLMTGSAGRLIANSARQGISGLTGWVLRR
jgi:hypothetical protein